MSSPATGPGITARIPLRALAAAVTIAALATLGVPAPARATSRVTAPTPSPVPPVGCASAVSVVVGRATSAPSPLPVPSSTVGGDQLSRPGMQVALPAGVPAPPPVRATAWLVADLTTGAVLAACNAHVPLAPASTLKVLTALSLDHRLNWQASYVGRPADAATDGSKVGIVAGSTYSVRDLFHGLMLSSGNDAATALATMAGGMPSTVGLMNAEARRLGALDTTAVNDSGLDARGQVSSAYDLALLGRAALADPALAGLVRTTTYTFPGRNPARGKKRGTFQIQNHNWLLTNFPGATGVKNGYTVAAGGSYIGSATRGGHTYLVTTLRAEGYTWRVAKALLDWAFVAGPSARPVGALVEPGQVSAAAPTRSPGDGQATGSGPGPVSGTASARAAGLQPAGPAAWLERSDPARLAEGVALALVVLLGLVGVVGARHRRGRSRSRGTRRPRSTRRRRNAADSRTTGSRR